MRIACLGEVLIRLTAPGATRMLQSAQFDVAIGGAEANVAVTLARLGAKVRLLSIVADNALGDAALAEIRRHGVDVDAVGRAPGRMGLYFLEQGAVLRPSRVTYDRAHSAFADLDPRAIDTAQWLGGCTALHVSGVTPAVSAAAGRLARSMVEAADAAGMTVIFDGNYREQLWRAQGSDGRDVLRDMLRYTHIAIINERDLSLVLGTQFSDRATAYAAAFSAFPKLRQIAATDRRLAATGSQTLAAEIVDRTGARAVAGPYTLDGVIDRIGTGDAFAAGLIDRLLGGATMGAALDFALACAVLKHSIPGDFTLVTRGEVDDLLAGGGIDVRR